MPHSRIFLWNLSKKTATYQYSLSIMKISSLKSNNWTKIFTSQQNFNEVNRKKLHIHKFFLEWIYKINGQPACQFVCRSVSRSVNRSVSRSSSQSVSRFLSWSVSRSVSRSISWLVCLSVLKVLYIDWNDCKIFHNPQKLYQLVSQCVNQSVSWFVSHSVNRCVSQSFSWSVSLSVSHSVSRSINQSVSRSVSRSIC